jgi:hypothetical protein
MIFTLLLKIDKLAKNATNPASVGFDFSAFFEKYKFFILSIVSFYNFSE